MPDQKECQNCAYVQKMTPPGELRTHLVCTRYPPTVAFVPAQDNFGRVGVNMVTGSPTVNENGHCGEWMPLPLSLT